MKKQQIIAITLLALAAAFTVACGDSHNPTFTKLPFGSDRTVNPSTPLFVANLDGSNVTPVSYNLSDFSSPSISADFKKISVTDWLNVWVMNSDGSNQTQLTDNAASNSYTYDARISPDGKKIVYAVWDNNTGIPTFWIMNSDGTGNLNLSATLPEGMTGCFNGSFSADSKQVAMVCYNNSTFTFGLYLIHPDGTHLSTVTTTAANGFIDTPMFTPNGKQILYIYQPSGPAAARKPGVGFARNAAAHRNVTPAVSSNGIVSSNLDGSNATVVVPSNGIWEAEILNSTLYYTLNDTNLNLQQIHKANFDGTNDVSISDGTADDWLGITAD